jgi:hypothetical protein
LSSWTAFPSFSSSQPILADPKNREHIDREGSFIGFCTAVALPFFDVVAKAVLPLDLFSHR